MYAKLFERGGGGVQSAYDGGGASPLQVRYTESGGGGGQSTFGTQKIRYR